MVSGFTNWNWLTSNCYNSCFLIHCCYLISHCQTVMYVFWCWATVPAFVPDVKTLQKYVLTSDSPTPSVLQCFEAIGLVARRDPAVKIWNDEVLAWLSVWCEVQWFAYGPANATATLWSLASAKSRMVYPSGTDLPRLSWKKAVKRLCVCVCVCAVSYTHLTLPTNREV